MRTNNRIFNLQNEVKFKWLFRASTWKMLWWASQARRGIYREVHSSIGRLRFGPLTRTHKRNLRIRGFKSLRVGIVLRMEVHLLKSTSKKK